MTNKNGDNRNILLIEDQGEMCLLLNLILDQEDLVIEHVKTLAEADAYLEKKLPALILLDNRLPDGLGVDYLGHLKKKYPWIKVILISGIDAAAEDFALEIGADAFLSKPFTKARLLASVNELMNRIIVGLPPPIHLADFPRLGHCQIFIWHHTSSNPPPVHMDVTASLRTMGCLPPPNYWYARNSSCSGFHFEEYPM
jgi:two-component system OmpR family response regulator